MDALSPATLPALDARRDLLRQARDRLERVTWHDRWGCSAMDYAAQAAELLRRAGLHELADEAGDEFGIDAGALIREIERELARGGREAA